METPQTAEQYSRETPDPRFPWGDNRPTRKQRILAALLIATVAALLTLGEYAKNSAYHSDFSIVWAGAKAIWQNTNPYEIVQKGLSYEGKWTWQTPMIYPGTALVLAMPLALLGEMAAAMTFTWISAFLMGYGITRRSWHLLPLLASEAFLSSARLAQWSMIFTAALFLPWVALIAGAKPQSAIPAAVQDDKNRTLKAAMAGGIVLLALSFMILPGWPAEWLRALKETEYMRPPLTQTGGFLIPLVLLRWRRKEAWLIMAMALLPASWGWYNVVALITVAATWHEAIALSALSTAGSLISGFIPMGDLDTFYRVTGAMLVASAYLPAVAVVLKRPNKGETPFWVAWLAKKMPGKS